MQLCLAPKVQKRGAPLQDERETLDARKCGELVGVAWTSLKSMGKTRWWSFFTMLESFMLNIKTLRYQRDSPHSDLVAPEVYNLSDLDWARNPFLASLVLSCLSHFLQRLYTLISYCH